ncbi:GET complex subunit get1 [Microbotryomycetes sp. JL201]|nr:GET complex subunit get1 [Microbotryomycetes sp. JL201]
MVMFDLDLAVLLFGVTLGVELVSWIGKDRLSDMLYLPYSRAFGTAGSSQQRRLRQEILQLRAELAGTSSQDEFSKWAKIRRKLDKAVAELEAANQDTVAAKQQFAKIFKAFLFVLTTVAPFIITSWHRKEAVFFLPPGWFGPATWWMGLPSAPAGGVACGIWTMACKRTINSAKDIVVDLLAKDSTTTTQQAPMAVPAESGRAQETPEKQSKPERPATHVRDEL